MEPIPPAITKESPTLTITHPSTAMTMEGPRAMSNRHDRSSFVPSTEDGRPETKTSMATQQTQASEDDEPGHEKTESPSSQDDYVTGYKLAIIVASVALSCFLMLLDAMIVSTAVPRITDEFNSLLDVGWYASAYQFGSATPQLLTGKIYTHFNIKWSFLAFFAIFEIGSVLCGAAVSSPMFIVGRAVAGFGAAGIIIGAITIISSCAPFDKRPGLLGITMGFNQLGLVAGPLIGGVFTSFSTWRWCFYVNLPFGAFAVLAIVLLRIPEQIRKERAIVVISRLHHYLDLVGFALFAPSILQLLLALQYGDHQYAWKSSQVIGLFCGSAATFAVWLLWNRYKWEDALLPHSMVRRMAVWASCVYQAFLMAAVYGGIYLLPLYFQSVNGATPILSGIYLIPSVIAQLIMAALSGAVLSKIGYVIPLAFFSTILLSTASGLYSLLQPGSSAGKWIGFQIIGGVGSGAGLQAIIAIQAAVSEAELSSGMALMVFAQSLGPAIALALYNVIFDASLQRELVGRAPGVDAQAVINAGATGFRSIVGDPDLPAVLTAYAVSIDRAVYLVAGMAAACGIFVWGMGWTGIRKKETAGHPSEATTKIKEHKDQV